MSHTPGPWTDGVNSDDWSVDSENHSSISWVGIGPQGHEPVAFAVWTGHYSSPQYAANARLIAAAPDMLAELIRVEETARELGLASMAATARAALAKAQPA